MGCSWTNLAAPRLSSRNASHHVTTSLSSHRTLARSAPHDRARSARSALPILPAPLCVLGSAHPLGSAPLARLRSALPRLGVLCSLGSAALLGGALPARLRSNPLLRCERCFTCLRLLPNVTRL